MRRRCPACGGNRHWKLGDGRFRCRRCRTRFRLKTAWEMSRLPEATKRRLAEMFALGVPAYRLRFRIAASGRSIERFYRIIRACCMLEEGMSAPFDGAIECDETMIGGRHKGKRGWGAAGKVIVFGILKRNGRVKVFPVSDRKHATLLSLVREHTKPGSLYYTDDYQAYASLGLRGEHVVVRKEGGRPKGRDHINGIEGFWSYAKNWLYPLRGIPRKNFHLYMAEICWRFNHRNQDLYPLIIKMLKNILASDIGKI